MTTPIPVDYIVAVITMMIMFSYATSRMVFVRVQPILGQDVPVRNNSARTIEKIPVVEDYSLPRCADMPTLMVSGGMIGLLLAAFSILVFLFTGFIFINPTISVLIVIGGATFVLEGVLMRRAYGHVRTS